MFNELPDLIAELFKGLTIDLELSLERTFVFEGTVFLHCFIHG